MCAPLDPKATDEGPYTVAILLGRLAATFRHLFLVSLIIARNLFVNQSRRSNLQIPVSSTLKLDLATLSSPLVRYGAEAAVRSHHLLSRYGAEAADACSPLLGRYGAEAYAISSPLLGRDAVIFHPLGRYGAEATYACSSPVLGLYASEADATASSLLGRNASKADATTSPLLDRHGANARFPLLGIGSRPATTATVAGVRGTATGALIRGNPCGFTVAGLAGSRSRFPLLGVGSVPATTVAGLAGSNLLPTRRYMSIFARKKISSDSVGDLENDPMARMASIMQQVVRDQMKIERFVLDPISISFRTLEVLIW